jgi:hypothetical protein
MINVQAPFDGENIYDDIVAGQYKFPTDVNVSDDAKVLIFQFHVKHGDGIVVPNSAQCTV